MARVVLFIIFAAESIEKRQLCTKESKKQQIG